MITAGIDAGSRAIKIVLLDSGSGRILAAGIRDQGVEQDRRAAELLDELLEEQGVDRDGVSAVVATGYGRNIISLADRTVTEITCHARGVGHVMKDVGTIIEIGGQDSKVVRLSETGAVRDFQMNDRCAAGTGRFLEVAAGIFDVDLQTMGEMATRSDKPAAISSMCVVFAETEIVGLLASGQPPEGIAAGVQASIATRVASMAGRIVNDPVVFTGGVALIPGMDLALGKAMGRSVSRVPKPQLTGALGAALIAAGR